MTSLFHADIVYYGVQDMHQLSRLMIYYDNYLIYINETHLRMHAIARIHILSSHWNCEWFSITNYSDSYIGSLVLRWLRTIMNLSCIGQDLVVFSISARSHFLADYHFNYLFSIVLATPALVCLRNQEALCLNYLRQVINRYFSQILISATSILIPFTILQNSYIPIAC